MHYLNYSLLMMSLKEFESNIPDLQGSEKPANHAATPQKIKRGKARKSKPAEETSSHPVCKNQEVFSHSSEDKISTREEGSCSEPSKGKHSYKETKARNQYVSTSSDILIQRRRLFRDQIRSLRINLMQWHCFMHQDLTKMSDLSLINYERKTEVLKNDQFLTMNSRLEHLSKMLPTLRDFKLTFDFERTTYDCDQFFMTMAKHHQRILEEMDLRSMDIKMPTVESDPPVLHMHMLKLEDIEKCECHPNLTNCATGQSLDSGLSEDEAALIDPKPAFAMGDIDSEQKDIQPIRDTDTNPEKKCSPTHANWDQQKITNEETNCHLYLLEEQIEITNDVDHILERTSDLDDMEEAAVPEITAKSTCILM